MAIIMISELPGAGPEFADVARQQGLFDQMKSAPGFMGHWSGATDSGYRVFEVWESPEATSVAAALRFRHCRSPNALPPGMLRSRRGRPAPRVDPEMPHARCAARPRSGSRLP